MTNCAQPLAGIRVLDLTHAWAGPLGTRILGDLGAQVLKIERPRRRSSTTASPMGGYIDGDPGDDPWNRGGVSLKLNRNKKSFAVDLKKPDGRDAFLDLVRVSDVVIENFSVRTMPALGLDYDVLREANNKIIYVAMPGYGTAGPYSELPAYGPSIEPMSGLGAVMGYSATEPRNSATALPDAVGGVTAAAAVVTALNRRAETGIGALVEVSLHEASVSFNGDFLVEKQLGGDPKPIGNGHPAHSYSDLLRTQGDDEWIAISCRTDAEQETLQEIVLGRDSSGFDKHDLAAQLQAAGIAAGPVNITPDFLDDPQVLARRFFVQLERSDLAPTPFPGSPMVINGDIDHTEWHAAPRLGEHNREVLEDWLGYEPKETERLMREGIIVQHLSR
jgi:crotonobetainyl-CoA:carnitine CoA-transferase CaiB-like acyl-CoA transferase